MSTFRLELPGYDPDESIWGYDPGQRVLYAQLYKPGQPDSDDGPAIWITPPNYSVHDFNTLACTIRTLTGIDIDAVIEALGDRPDYELYTSG